MNVIEEMKLLSEDHTHDGWPAVKMSEITQLIEIIEKQAERIAELERERDEWKQNAIDLAKYPEGTKRGDAAFGKHCDLLEQLRKGELC